MYPTSPKILYHYSTPQFKSKSKIGNKPYQGIYCSSICQHQKGAESDPDAVKQSVTRIKKKCK